MFRGYIELRMDYLSVNRINNETYSDAEANSNFNNKQQQ
jgi:hypothetical protein